MMTTIIAFSVAVAKLTTVAATTTTTTTTNKIRVMKMLNIYDIANYNRIRE